MPEYSIELGHGTLRPILDNPLCCGSLAGALADECHLQLPQRGARVAGALRRRTRWPAAGQLDELRESLRQDLLGAEELVLGDARGLGFWLTGPRRFR